MPIIYSLVTRHFMERCSTIDIRQTSIKMCYFLLLSFLSTIIINVLLPNFILKISPSLISSSSLSSLSLLTSTHIYFPSDLISIQHHHELQTDFQGNKRTYTKDHSKQKNISSGKNFHSQKRYKKSSIIIFRSSTRSRNCSSFSFTINS